MSDGEARGAKKHRVEAYSKERYRASSAERAVHGENAKTVTIFYVYRSVDANDSTKWKEVKGYGATPGERKTYAIRASGLLE